MRSLDNGELLAKYDREGMIAVLDRFPDQCRDAIEIGQRFDGLAKERPDKMIVSGMGGSAMAGEIARRFSRIPVFVNRSYSLPGFADRHTLLVAISYSGNTAETLSALHQGIERAIPSLCISSGGRLEEIAETDQIPFLKIPSGYQPRAAMGHLAIPLLEVMSRIEVLKGTIPWESVLEGLRAIQTRCTGDVPTVENPAKKLACTLLGNVPLLYGTTDNTDLVAMRWKTQINENAKQAAFWNAIPELNHNEILALVKAELLANQFVVLLRNDYDLPGNLDRIRIMKGLFSKKLRFTEVVAAGASEIAQVFSQVYLGDYVSFYLALLNGVDPTPVSLIEQLKRELEAGESDR
jgi:glucose/mannose-6-phosphate isomerase